MWARHPKLAKEWTEKYGSKPTGKVKKTMDKKRKTKPKAKR